MEGVPLVQSLVERLLAAARNLEEASCLLLMVWVSDEADQNHRYAALQLGFPIAVALAVDQLRDAAAVMSTADE